MLKNYLKIALRHLLKHKGYSFINFAGLAAGMAGCILIMLWVRFELSYDTFPPAAGRIFRVVQEQRFSGSVQQVAVVAAPIGPALARDYAEVESMVRLRPRTVLASYGEKKFFGERILYADSNAFTFFALPLLQGDAATALVPPRALVITAALAKKYFDGEEPLGKTLRINARDDYTVTGVMVSEGQQIMFTTNGEYDLDVRALAKASRTARAATEIPGIRQKVSRRGNTGAYQVLPAAFARYSPAFAYGGGNECER